MREAKTFTIGDKTFQVSTWTNKKAKRILTKLSKLLGESIVMFADKDQISNAISILTSKMNDDDLEVLSKEILELTFYGTQSVTEQMDNIFGTNLLLEFKVIGETLKFQYQDFFGDSAGIKEMFAALRI